MIESLFEILNLILIEVIGLFIAFFSIILFWKNIYQSLTLKAYDSKQRLHQDEVSRIGGLIIYIFLIFVALLSFQSQLLNIILISAIPIMFIGAKEDLYNNTRPELRLFFMIVSAAIFIYLLPTNLPEIDFPLINILLSFSLMKEIFFIFSILVIINGNNLIDGVNGSMALTNIAQLFALIFLAVSMEDFAILELCVILLIPLVIFLIFNYPFGKIFSGDAGAYFFGFSISAVVIFLFGSHSELLSWNAVLILIFPSIEILFSFIRKKFFENISPFSPDLNHIHSLIFRYFSKKFKLVNNSFVIVFIFPLIIAPFLVYLFFTSILNTILSIFIIFIFYIIVYTYFSKLVNKYD